jgi:dihydrodipicolinate synthase/N-acetylneuraminate lyase
MRSSKQACGGLMLCSGTVEYAYLRDEERQRLIELGAQHVAGRLPTSTLTNVGIARVSMCGKLLAKHIAGHGAELLQMLLAAQ